MVGTESALNMASDNNDLRILLTPNKMINLKNAPQILSKACANNFIYINQWSM
jgi:hypothetical protein